MGSVFSRFTGQSAIAAIGLGVACIVAYFLPAAIALGGAGATMPGRAATTILVAGILGAAAARSVGLSIGFASSGSAIAALRLAAIVALAIFVVDAVALASGRLPGIYLAFISNNELTVRLAGFMSRAYVENIVYRLFGTAVLACAIGRFWRNPDERPADGAFWSAIALAQIINVAVNVVARRDDPMTFAMLAYDFARYVLPGMAWGYLFWKRGFGATEIASTSVHIFLQPPLGWMIGNFA